MNGNLNMQEIKQVKDGLDKIKLMFYFVVDNETLPVEAELGENRKIRLLDQ